MKAQEILEKAYQEIEAKQDSSSEVVDPILIGAMEEHALRKMSILRGKIIDIYTNGGNNFDVLALDLKEI